MKLTVDYSPEFQGELVQILESLSEELDNLEKIEIVPAEDRKLRVSVDGRVVVDAEHEFSTQKIVDSVTGETEE